MNTSQFCIVGYVQGLESFETFKIIKKHTFLPFTTTTHPPPPDDPGYPMIQDPDQDQPKNADPKPCILPCYKKLFLKSNMSIL